MLAPAHISVHRIFDRHTSALTNIGTQFRKFRCIKSWCAKELAWTKPTNEHWASIRWRAAHDHVHSLSLSFRFTICKLFFGRSLLRFYFGARLICCVKWNRMLKGKIAHWRKIIGLTCALARISPIMFTLLLFRAFFFIKKEENKIQRFKMVEQKK